MRPQQKHIPQMLLEPFESRWFLTALGGEFPDPAYVKIPVLSYHRGFDLGSDTSGMATSDIGELKFRQTLDALIDYDPNQTSEPRFHSISLDQYWQWRTDPQHLAIGMPALPWFIAMFDDSHRQELDAAAIMAEPQYAFKGVTAIPTNDVERGAEGLMSWAEIRKLTGPATSGGYDWDVASHGKAQKYLGDGPNRPGVALPTSNFRNEPDELIPQIHGSKHHIVDNTGKFPRAFVHPFNDITLRTLAVAGDKYDMVFGLASAGYIGATTDLFNGELVRIPINDSTEIDGVQGFKQMLVDAASASFPFVRPLPPDLPASYVARAGTVVIDGSSSSDTITLTADELVVIRGGSTTRVPIGELSANYRDGRPTIQQVSITGYRGGDTITCTMDIPSTIRGGAGDDALTGGSANDVIYGGAGADRICGSGASDKLFGDGGNDRIHGGDHNDLIDGGGGVDRVWGEGGNDTILGGGSDDKLDGGLGDDSILGGSGNDALYCGGGADTLIGNKGDDELHARDDAIDVLDGSDGTDAAWADDTLDGMTRVEQVMP